MQQLVNMGTVLVILSDNCQNQETEAEMKYLNSTFKPSVTLLVLSFMTLAFCIASPVQAVRIKHRGNTATTTVSKEYVSPWSLQIFLDERINDDDDDYSGIQLSLSHFMSGKSALRFNLGFFNRNSGFDEEKVFRHNDAEYIFEKYDEFDVAGVNLSLQGMFYSSPKKEPRLYWGIGPRLGIRDANPSVLVDYYDDPPGDLYILDYDDGTLVSFGLEGTLGFEWFLGQNMSMVAEYGLAAQKEWYILDFDYYDYRGRRTTETETFDDGFHLDASYIRLGLSMYF